MPDSVIYKEGCNYTLSFLASDSVSASMLTSKDIALTGTETGDSPKIESVIYDLKTNKVNLILKEQYGYDISYKVSADSETYECETEESLPAIFGTVSIKSVKVSEDGSTADITVYNATYTEVTKTITGTAGDGDEVISSSVTIPAESAYTFTATGTDLQNLTWTITD